MPISNDTQKLAVMEWGIIYEPGLPFNPIGQAKQQQLLWGFPGILWGVLGQVTGSLYYNMLLAGRKG